MKILVIEDDKTLGNYICQGLNESGFTTDHCDDGREGLFMAASESYDLIIMDRMLPNVDGLTIVRTLRASQDNTPIIILSALDEVDQRVEGLAAGGDDYLTKPFAFKELLARIQVLLRRGQHTNGEQTELIAADVKLDLIRQSVWIGEDRVPMQQREFRLLEYLIRHQGQLVTRTMLLENVWDYHFDPQTNIIDVHISRLRRKLDINREKSLITTIRGAGYVLDTISSHS